MSKTKWTYNEHIAAMKKIYPSADEYLKKDIITYMGLIKNKTFDDFDEHLLLISVCEHHFKIPIPYADRVYIEDNTYMINLPIRK